MENTIKPQKIISQKIAEFFFMLYMITLYLFVDKAETVIISKLVFVLFAVFTVLAVLRGKNIHIGKNVMTVYVAFTWMFATVLWAQDKYNATYMVKTMWQLFVQFFLVYNLFAGQTSAHDKIIKNLYIAGIALVCYSIYIYGLADVIAELATGNMVRLGSEISQENSFGTMNATTAVLAFYYLIYKRKHKVFHVVVAALSFLYAMSSGSRKAVLMIFIGVAFLVMKKYKIKHAYKTVAIGLVVMLLLIWATNLPMFDFINSRMEGMVALLKGEEGADSSAKLRLRMITDGWEAFKDNFLIGYGANNFRNVSRYRSYSHNNFIEILVDFGLIGFTLYYAVYLLALKNLWKAKHDSGKALFVVFVARLLMEVALVTYYSKLQWVIMAFALLAVSNESKTSTEAEEETIVAEEPKPAKKPGGRELKFDK